MGGSRNWQRLSRRGEDIGLFNINDLDFSIFFSRAFLAFSAFRRAVTFGFGWGLAYFFGYIGLSAFSFAGGEFVYTYLLRDKACCYFFFNEFHKELACYFCINVRLVYIQLRIRSI